MFDSLHIIKAKLTERRGDTILKDRGLNMHKQAIMNTAVCYWSEEDDCFVVESPLLEIIAGVGETREGALCNFERHIDTAYESYLEGRMKHICD